MNNFDNNDNIYAYNSASFEKSENAITGFNTFLRKVFLIMFFGIFATFAVTYSVVFFAPLQVKQFVANTYYVWLIAEIIVVIAFSASARKASYGVALAMFTIYAILSGLTMTVFCWMFGSTAFNGALLFTSAYFALLALYGYTTKKDLSSMRNLLTVSLFIILGLSIFNLFFYSASLEFMIILLGLVIFTGFTMYDVQKLKNLYFSMSQGNLDSATANKLAVFGALTLYLDFINLFIYILRLLNLRRD